MTRFSVRRLAIIPMIAMLTVLQLPLALGATQGRAAGATLPQSLGTAIPLPLPPVAVRTPVPTAALPAVPTLQVPALPALPLPPLPLPPLPLPPLPSIPSLPPLSTLLGLLHFDFHTVYRAPDGHEVTRDTLAIPVIPTPLDITGDGIPDAIGDVLVTSVSPLTFKLSINKLPLAQATLPAQVELVIHNPADSDPNSLIAGGYDARDHTMPTAFTTTLTLFSFSAPLHLALDVQQAGAQAGFALIASFFTQAQGGPRSNTMTARAAFTPPPATLGLDVLVDAHHDHVTVTSSAPTNVVAHATLVDPVDSTSTEERAIDGSITGLPSRVDVDVIDQDASHRQISYTAATVMQQLAFVYDDVTHRPTGDVLNTEAGGSVVGLPKGVTFTQTGARQFGLTTQGGPIQFLEGGFASGEHVVPLPGTVSGINVVRGGGLSSIFGRLRGLQTATIDAGGPYSADVQSATQPLRILVQDNDARRTIDGMVRNLPAHLTIAFDPDRGTLAEDGHGQGINTITLDARSATAFFGRATHLALGLHGIPSLFNAAFTQGNGAFAGSISPSPIREVDLSADDGTTTASVPGPASQAGFTYTDLPARFLPPHNQVPGQFALAGRVFGLNALSFQSNPLSLHVNTAGPQVFNLAATVDLTARTPLGRVVGNTVRAAGQIDRLPSDLTLSLSNPASAPSQTDVVYRASAPIDTLTFDAVAFEPFFGGDDGATHIHADLHGIPAAFNLTIDDPGDSFSAVMDHPVDEIDVEADDGNSPIANVNIPQEWDSGVSYTDVPGGHYGVLGRVFGLSEVEFSHDPLSVEVKSAGGHVLTVKASLPFDDQNVTFNGVVDQLPSDVSFAMHQGDSGTAIAYNASSPIDKLEVGLFGSSTGRPFFGRAHYVYGNVLGLPATPPPIHTRRGTIEKPALSVTLPSSGPLMALNAAQTIGRVKVEALGALPTSTPNQPPTLDDIRDLVQFSKEDGTTAADADGVVYHDLFDPQGTPAEYSLALQLSGLRSASVQTDPYVNAKLDVDPAKAQVFGVDVQTQNENSEVQELPALAVNGCDARTIDGEFVGAYFKLGFQNASVVLPCNAAATLVASALAHMQVRDANGNPVGPPVIGPGNISGAGGPEPDNAIDLTFGGTLAYTAQPTISLSIDVTGSGQFVPYGGLRRLVAGGGAPSPVTYYKGFIDKPPPNLNVSVGTGGLSGFGNGQGRLLQYSAGAVVPKLELRSNFGDPKQYFRLTLTDIPQKLNMCLGHDTPSGGSCQRYTAMHHRLNQYDRNHRVTVNVDDMQTATSPMGIDVRACFDTGDQATCESQVPQFRDIRANGPSYNYLAVQNLKITNWYFDADAETSSGALVSGHLAMDTAGQPNSGTIVYSNDLIDENAGTDDGIFVAVSFPTGFNATQRYVHFQDNPFALGTSYTLHGWAEGSVDCPSGTSWPVVIYGSSGPGGPQTAFAGADLAQEFFC